MIKRKGLDCIVLVDDDDATNFIHNLVIKKSNLDVHVEVCTSGRKALDYLTCQGQYSASTEYPQPGIIFLDINMPGMSGWEFLEEYEKLPQEQKARVVVAMLTTSLNPDDQKKGDENRNVKRFMHKPLTIEMLMKVVDDNFKD